MGRRESLQIGFCLMRTPNALTFAVIITGYQIRLWWFEKKHAMIPRTVCGLYCFLTFSLVQIFYLGSFLMSQDSLASVSASILWHPIIVYAGKSFMQIRNFSLCPCYLFSFSAKLRKQSSKLVMKSAPTKTADAGYLFKRMGNKSDLAKKN